MVWAGISIDAKTELVFIETGRRAGGLTADRYIEEILGPYVVPYVGFVRETFILMQDNARPHSAAPYGSTCKKLQLEFWTGQHVART